MSTTVVVLKGVEFVPEFLKDAEVRNYRVRPVKGLKRFFIVEDMTPEKFDLSLQHYIQAVDDGEHELKPEAVAQPTTVEASGLGGWAAPRIIRREPPWGSPITGKFPFNTTFSCERTGEGVDIYMIDAGVALDHPEFEGRASMPWRYDYSYSLGDDSGHGTACASVAMGATVGIARNASFRCFKFYDGGSGSGTTRAIEALGAILVDYEDTANSGRPAVAFFSWSGFSSTINVAVSELIDAGIIFCAPAGNDITDLDTVDQYPAESDPDNIICGGSNIADHAYYNQYYDETEEVWKNNGTNYGTPVTICAPAQNMGVADNPTGYRVGSGTSYATPAVAGVIACMLQGYARLTTRAEVQAVKAKLLENATRGALKQPIQFGGTTGFDPLNPEAGGEVAPTLPDRLLYLDPFIPFELIPGLTPAT